jgi:cytochrome c oxidase subunit 3
MTIPYTVTKRPDTGVNNVKLGVWLFLASEVMLFGGLFSAYFTLLAGALEPWPPLRNHLALASLNTIVLLAAGASIALAIRNARAGLTAGHDSAVPFRGWLMASGGFALTFCALKMIEYADLFRLHLRPSTSTQLAMYFLLTGVHLLHVLGGIGVLLWLALTSSKTRQSSAPAVVNRLEAAAMYWYFVDVIWLILFVLLYVA